MQYVWQHRLWPYGSLSTVDGRQVTVIDQGRLNTASGPDFFNAKVRIGDRIWAGDVEIHVNASDWHRHGHDGDRAYDSVILHVVDRDDTPIARSNGEIIPQLRLPCSADFYRRYTNMVDRADRDLPCADTIADLPPLYITDWIASLALERIYNKIDRINELLRLTAGDWDQACFVTIARALGFGINSEPMQLLASRMPLSVLYKHADSQLAVEALLFGRSGLLDGAPEADPYVASLKREYAFLSAKFGLKPIDSIVWKTGGLRPQNQPHRRIAALAALIHSRRRLFSEIVNVDNPDDAFKIFDVELTGFWASNYTFRNPAASGPDTRPARLSRSSISILIINVVAPMIVAYGLAQGEFNVAERAVGLLESMKAESNSVVERFSRAGIKAKDALMSQALVQLRREYCETRKCLYCRIGHRMLAAHALRAGQ